MSFETTCRVPSDPRDITKTWLEARLRNNGFLDPGEGVIQVDIQLAPKWNVATPARIHIEYEPGTSGSLPKTLFVKLDATVDPMAEFFPGEVAFYAETIGEDVGTPICYAAVTDPESGHRCLLLEDLSETHSQPPWPLTPTFRNCELAIDALAAAHAHGWRNNDEDLKAATLRVDDGIQSEIIAHLPKFLNYLGDRLSADRHRIVDAAARAWTRLKADRVKQGDCLTRAQGDPHSWNFLYPNDPQSARCVLIDWEDWRPNLAMCDPAQMMALHWYKSVRDRFEVPLLDRYRHALAARGVDYPEDRMSADYKLAHLGNIHIPIIQHALDKTADVWWPHLDRWCIGFDDLDCASLL